MKSQYPAHPNHPQAPNAMRLRCALRLDARTLSAWRDRLLSPAEDARVSAHLADDDCAACQAQLAAYDAIAVALRAQRAPTPAPLDMAALHPLLLQAPTAQPRLRLLPFRRPASTSQPSRASRSIIPTSFAVPRRAAPAGASGVPTDAPTRGAEGPLADPRLLPGWAAAQSASTGGALRLVETAEQVTSLPVARTRLYGRDGLWRGLGAAVAVVLLVTALAQLLLHTEVGRGLLGAHTAPPTTPILNAPPTANGSHTVARLKWTQAALPPGFQPALYSTNTIAVAPSDGLTAYACYPTGDPSQSAPQVWVTHDAHTWRQAATFPATAEGYCDITVDAADPSRMIVGLAWPGPPDATTNGLDRYYATDDSGQTWRQITGLGNVDLLQLATLDGAQFAFVQAESAPSPYFDNHLLVSRDDMQTWTPADGGIVGDGATSGQQVYELWVNPFTNELAALALLGGDLKYPSLWESRDAGQTWREVSQMFNADYVAQTPSPGRAWSYCAYSFGATSATIPFADELTCAPFDDSISYVWLGLGQSFADAFGAPVVPDSLFALTPAGDTLVSSNVLQSDGSRYEHIYRFSVASGRWQDIGSPPTAQAMLLYAPTAAGGSILWTTPDPYGGTTTLYTVTYS